MKRRIVLVTVVVGLVGVGVAAAAPSGISRIVLAKGTMDGVQIEAEGPLEVGHRVTSWEPGGTTGWASWEGDLLVTMNKGELTFTTVSDGKCGTAVYKVGESYVIPAGSVYEAANHGEGVAEVHWVSFLPPGSTIREETEPAECADEPDQPAPEEPAK